MQSKDTSTDKSKAENAITAAVVADAAQDNWVYRLAPRFCQPYLKLARIDRPVGIWLLLWPCLWSLMLAKPSDYAVLGHYTLLFFVGATVMRGAGCTVNDIIDRKIDAQVERTASRPIPAGEVSTTQALLFLIAQGFAGLLVLIQFNDFTILLGVSSLMLVGAYPFMKRITWWPQAWLGLTFNWGVLMGYAAVDAALAENALVLYAGCIAWTIGYDTIYAHQDREDDALIGVKSSALRLGDKTAPALVLFYGIFLIAFGFVSYQERLLLGMLPGLFIVALLLVKQVRELDINDGAKCLQHFKMNNQIGIALTANLLVLQFM